MASGTEKPPVKTPPIEVPTARPSSDPDHGTPRLRKSSNYIKILVVLALIAGACFAYPYAIKWYESSAVSARREATKPIARVIPVVTATARRGNMDLYLTGLGTVTPLRTVTIRSRVEGELIKVFFKEGDTVQKDALIAQIDPRPYKVLLDQAVAQKNRDEATLKNARAILSRNMELFKSRAIAQQDVDTQFSLVQELEAAIQTDQAKIDEARLNLEFCEIKAPITGRIGLRTLDQGNLIRANDPVGLAVITQTQPIAVVFTIPQDSIVRVQKQINTGRTLPVEAYNRDIKTKLASGTFLAIDNQVDPGTGTVKLKASFENKENILFPNQFVNTRLLLETRQDVILVPSVAIQNGPSGNFVYVVNKQETIEIRPVTLGPMEAETIVIEKGLSAGEIVVIDGVDKLQSGTKVTTRKPVETNSSPQRQNEAPQSSAKDSR